MFFRITLATTLLLMSLPSIGADIKMDTYIRHATAREFNGLYDAYVVTSLRGADLERNLAERLKILCHENSHLDKYKISVYADSDSADFARKNVGALPNLMDQQWQKMERALLAFFNPFDGILTIHVHDQKSRDISSKKIDLGKAWCRN